VQNGARRALNRRLLAKGIEVIGVLFAAFGGFLAGIAPPEAADAKFAVGLSSFCALIILFAIAAVASKQFRKVWTLAALALLIVSFAAALYYKATYDRLTFEYPPGAQNAEYIAGTELTPEAREYLGAHDGLSKSQLLAKFGGLENKNKVWPEGSVNKARNHLIAIYVVLVLSIATAVFSLTEGAFSKARGGSIRSRNSKGGDQ